MDDVWVECVDSHFNEWGWIHCLMHIYLMDYRDHS